MSLGSISRPVCLGLALSLLGALLTSCAAQSDDGVSLGDLARSLRNKKGPASAAVIDNDNLAEVMQQVESRHNYGSLVFSIEPVGKQFQVISPDATCSLSFNANATALLTPPVVPVELPAADLAKLDGPAIIDDDTLQISVHNGSEWNLREIIVGLTIVRADPDSYENAIKLLPASQNDPVVAEKHSDTTLLLHLKGTAAPSTTAVFREKLGNILTPDQDWHWSILQAKGLPPDPVPAKPGYASGQ
jgi:hypothetical protein